MLFALSIVTFPLFSQYTTVQSAAAIPSPPDCDGEDCFRITNAQNSQKGAAWSNTPLDLLLPFELDICIFHGDANTNLTCFDDSEDNGADGMAFVLRDPGSITIGLGGAGGSLAFQGIFPSIAIEFDVYPNGASVTSDPSFDHTAIVIDGLSTAPAVVPIGLRPNNSNVEDGDFHEATIDWNPVTQELRMAYEGIERVVLNQNIATTVFTNNTSVLYGFTGSTGGCNNLQQVCVEPFLLGITDTLQTCVGDTIDYAFYTPFISSYSWRAPDGSFLEDWDFDVTDPFPDTSFAFSQSGWYFLEVVKNGKMYQDSILVDIIDPEFTLQDDIETCEEIEVLLDPEVTHPSAEFIWSTGETAPTLSVTENGLYWLEVNILGCTYRDTFQLEAYDIQFSLESPLILCEGDSIRIGYEHPDLPVEYEWSTGDSIPYIWVDEEGEYSLSLAFEECVEERTVDISTPVYDPLSPVEDVVCRGEEREITANLNTEVAAYIWDDGTTEDTRVVSEEGWYSLEAELQGCTFIDSVFVEYDLCCWYAFPSAISPNGDGRNESFEPISNCSWITPRLSIYNRWGEQVFRDNTDTWFGVDSDGALVSQGVYTYVIRFIQEDGDIGEFTGSLLVTR